MTGVRSRYGALLVTVLLFSAAVWVLVAGALIMVRLRHDVAVAALHHARARVVALHAAERADAFDWWAEGTPEPSGASGSCVWDVTQLAQTPRATRYEVRATYLRAQVIVEGTALR